MTFNLTQLLFLGSSRPSGWNRDIVYLKTAAMMSFHAEKRCHLASKHEASAGVSADADWAASASFWSIVHLYVIFWAKCSLHLHQVA